MCYRGTSGTTTHPIRDLLCQAKRDLVFPKVTYPNWPVQMKSRTLFPKTPAKALLPPHFLSPTLLMQLNRHPDVGLILPARLPTKTEEPWYLRISALRFSESKSRKKHVSGTFFSDR